MTLHLWTVLVRSLLVSCPYYPWCALFEISGCLTSFDCGIRDVTAQGKSLTDDSLHVESVGKVFAGQMLAYSGPSLIRIAWDQSPFRLVKFSD